MPIALIADAYPPLRTSAAVQLRDLAHEFVLQGHELVVMVPSPKQLAEGYAVEIVDGVRVLRLPASQTKDTGYVRRAISEMLLPFAMLRGLRRSPFRSTRWDGVIWYSPSIFLGPLVSVLKRSSRCRSYLILRDIFPEWAVDMGLLRRGVVYRFFKWIERYQYSLANTIGVQTASNTLYFAEWAKAQDRRIEVLQNWLSPTPNVGCSISISTSPLSGRTIFVFAGNMGIAQGMDIVLDLVDRLRNRLDIGFMLVGRGSECSRLQNSAKERGLANIVFHAEIDPSEIPGLLAQCHIGLVMLDPRHRTHNVPGKFLAYMQAGLPVLARINSGNDLADVIEQEGVGRVYVGNSADSLASLAEELVNEEAERMNMSRRARNLAERLYAPAIVVRKIVAGLQDDGNESEQSS